MNSKSKWSMMEHPTAFGRKDGLTAMKEGAAELGGHCEGSTPNNTGLVRSGLSGETH